MLPDSDSRSVGSKPVYFVFGNHKHWAGMVWEWGEDTLVNSTAALARVIDETGLKAGLNFDGRGVEQLAVYDPPSIEKLKSLLAEGKVELWGGTYTQPYGGLIGHESNIRHRVAGIRAFERILGERPKVFAEEEFDFFPQLPQILSQLGYEAALLFPQHTWHTPTIPCEEEAVIDWEGIDGTKIRAIPYSNRCLMRGIPTAIETMKEIEPGGLMITWLEMLDKPNWMWRTDFVLKYLKEMQAEPGYEIRPTTILEYIRQLRVDNPPSRRYSLDEVFHGVSVGKNGDALPKQWSKGEARILEAEFLAAWCSFLGQPYPQYDSYPEWQLEEAWRFLMQSQGHDAYECAGLTGFVGDRYSQTAKRMAKDVAVRSGRHISVTLKLPDKTPDPLLAPWCTVTADGRVAGVPLAEPVGLPIGWSSSEPKVVSRGDEFHSRVEIKGEIAEGSLRWAATMGIAFAYLDMEFHEKPEPGILKSVLLPIRLSSKVKRWRVDSPFAVVDVNPSGEWLHRQPTGHWLTSAQVDELIPNPLTYLSFVHMQTADGGLLFASRQNKLAIAREDGLDAVVYGYDAWDGDNWLKDASTGFAIAPLSNPTNRELLDAAAWMTNAFRPEKFGESFVCCDGPAWITCVRKAGEELEVRLFETEGSVGEAVLNFDWEVEDVRCVNPLGEPLRAEFSAEDNQVAIQLAPRQIVTLRILFKGKRTEYLDIDKYRDVWVGN